MPPSNLTKRLPRSDSSAWAMAARATKIAASSATSAILFRPRAIRLPRLPPPPRQEGPQEVAQLQRPVGEAADAFPGRPVLEVEPVLAQAIAGADGVDRHPDL